MLTDSSSSYASDLWALGCIIYQMVSGSMPFRGQSEYLIFQKILNLDYEYPEGFDRVAKDLVDKLLVVTPDKRLGATDDEPYIRYVEIFSIPYSIVINNQQKSMWKSLIYSVYAACMGISETIRDKWILHSLNRPYFYHMSMMFVED